MRNKSTTKKKDWKYQDLFNKKERNQKINEIRLSLITIVLIYFINICFLYFNINIQKYFGAGLVGAGLFNLLIKYNNGVFNEK